jgi:uncharacterized protein with NRDE domain
MCLAALAIGQSARFPWVLLSNRDEFFHRTAETMAWWHPWPGGPRILSGRDRSGGGTWLGLNETGHLALVTNVREPDRVSTRLPSRGDLVLQWLLGERDESALQAKADVPRNGFNLLTADLFAAAPEAAVHPAAWWLSNRPQVRHQALGVGLYGLSNAALDTPWPKVAQIKSRLQIAVRGADSLSDLMAAGFAALGDRAVAPDALLPRTGLPLQRERLLSSAFIRTGAGAAPSAAYGTRCATVVVSERLRDRCVVHVIERSFDVTGGLSSQVSMQLRRTH